VEGKHPKYVQERLGHASISITLDTYSHVVEEMDGGLADACTARCERAFRALLLPHCCHRGFRLDPENGNSA
jgi:hypothetical protein